MGIGTDGGFRYCGCLVTIRTIGATGQHDNLDLTAKLRLVALVHSLELVGLLSRTSALSGSIPSFPALLIGVGNRHEYKLAFVDLSRAIPQPVHRWVFEMV
jgi:hypothetical protein